MYYSAYIFIYLFLDLIEIFEFPQKGKTSQIARLIYKICVYNA